MNTGKLLSLAHTGLFIGASAYSGASNSKATPFNPIKGPLPRLGSTLTVSESDTLRQPQQPNKPTTLPSLNPITGTQPILPVSTFPLEPLAPTNSTTEPTSDSSIPLGTSVPPLTFLRTTAPNLSDKHAFIHEHLLAPNPPTDNLLHMVAKMGGTNIAVSTQPARAVSYEKTVINPKTKLAEQRHFTLYPPRTLTPALTRGLKATLRIGNPRTYGTPDYQEVPLSAKEHKIPTPSLDDILNNNYVITIRNGAETRFGAMAVVHPYKDSDPHMAYIGQVVSGPRDPQAGANKRSLGSEVVHEVKGGGTLAVEEAIRLAAHLGFSQARLYTDRASLGDRESAGGEPTYYDKFAGKLGIEVNYNAKLRDTVSVPQSIPSTLSHQTQAIMGKDHTFEYHYTYSVLERLL